VTHQPRRHCTRFGGLAPFAATLVAAVAAVPLVGSAQTKPAHSDSPAVTANANAAAPPDYLIGPGDKLSIVFWRDKDMSGDVVVRPDGKISLPLLNEIQAAGYTPEQLRVRLTDAAKKFVEEPNATVVVQEILSRNAYITGNVAKPGTYSVSANLTVLQLIALAGGLQEYADAKHIVIVRAEDGRQQFYQFNYQDVVKQKHPDQNIVLRPGDTIVVP
jgi:polysaccharide export outer membrane protein